MVSATTMDSITWTWNAVEGALGYAVQVSHDEMFDDTDMTHPTTETTFTASDLEPETSVFVRVRAAAGTVEAPLVSAWTTHVTGMSAMPPPPPPAPMAAPTPTGLMSESGDHSITWSWEAVDGADGYAVQVSMDEMFDDMDETHYIPETSHMVEDLGYSETRFARVASTSGEGDDMLMSMWTTHVTGMSNAAPPLPPPSVSFSLPDGQSHFMVADDDDDEETAMAWLNPKTMVDSDSTAIITPMWMEGASGVSVDAASDNMPFTHVGAADNWELLQSAVLDGGATFMVQRARLGANQEMEPVNNDVSYITCGPFECQEGMDPPMISIANSTACTAWDPVVDIQLGKVDNDVIVGADGDADGVITNDGVDLGIVTSSSLEMTVKHVFSGVENGKNTSVATTAKKGSNQTLAMKALADVFLIDEDPNDTPDDHSDDIIVCDNEYDMGSITDRPKGCFRMRGHGTAKTAPDYFSGYSIELAPKGAGVSWGRVAWDTDPFKDLKCDPMTMMVADEVDICAMFEDEVDHATRGKGWQAEVIFNSSDQIEMWRATTEKASEGGKNFKTLWFDDNVNGKIKDDPTSKLTRGRPEASSGTAGGDMHDLYNQNDDANNLEHIWDWLTDVDGDPSAGDLGKVDMAHDTDVASTTTVDESATDDNAVHPDGKADNYPDTVQFSDVRACSEADGGDDDDGTICDAEWSVTHDVLFADGTFGCTATRSVTISCTWDADGGMADGRNGLPQAPVSFSDATVEGHNLGNFLKCSAK